MWPGGDATQERVLSVGTISCVGQATRDEGDVRKGERVYDVRLYKDTSFGGPSEPPAQRGDKVWRRGTIRGHFPGARGAWDLLGGALRHLLDARLNSYVAVSVSSIPEEVSPEYPPLGEESSFDT
jgi:hypothetical protein